MLSELNVQLLLACADAEQNRARGAHLSVVTGKPGLAVAGYAGEAVGSVERSVFEGGVLICICLAGLD